MRTLWTFGDSYTAEYVYENDNSYSKYKELKGYEIKTWPTILSEKLGTRLVNKAKGGSSNYDIFHSFMKCFDLFKENDVIIIGWALVTKFKFVVNDHLMSIDPHTDDEFFKKIVENRKNFKWTEEVDKWINFIKNVCHCKNVRVFFWSSEDQELLYGEKYKKTYETYNDKNILLNESNCGLIFYLMNMGVETIDKETNGIIPDCHLSENGNKSLADLFYKQIMENKFL